MPIRKQMVGATHTTCEVRVAGVDSSKSWSEFLEQKERLVSGF